MDASSLFFLIFTVLGGLALFIFGMNIMSDSLRTVAGSGLRIRDLESLPDADLSK